MVHPWLKRICFSALVVTFIIASGKMLNALGFINPWLLYPQIPIPAAALHPQVEYYHPSMDEGQYRRLSFETSQSQPSVLAFYRSELQKQGWNYLGVAQPYCTDALELLASTTDIYDKDGRMLSVKMRQSPTSDIQQISVAEYLYAGAENYALQQPPAAGADLHTKALGFWKAVNTASEELLIFCIYDQGSIELFLSENQIVRGSYQWAGNELQMTFEATRNAQQPEIEHERALLVCRELFALFNDGCRSETKLITPMSYPGPNETQPATPLPVSDIPAYIAPGQYLTEVMHISGTFIVDVNEETLMITNRLGTRTTFHRVSW